MRLQRLTTLLVVALSIGSGFSPAEALVQNYEASPLEARVWLDRGHEPVLQRGEGVRLYYRVSESAFVAIFHIDTNGTTRLVFPTSPQESHFARGGRDYRVLFPGSSYWYVGDDPGMGYFFMVASPEPFDLESLRYSHYDGGWDLSFVGRQVYGDPYLAMDDYVSALIPDWEYVGYGLDFTAYNVEQRYEYPRFMCYDCHGFRPFYSWNPYHYSCSSFRMVIYDDPYYYPVTRYRGTRVVYVQPRRGLAHFGFKERAVGEIGTPQVVQRNTPRVSQPGVAGTENRRVQPRAGAPSVVQPGVSPSRTSGSRSSSVRPGVESSGTRRPSSRTGGTPLVSPRRPTTSTRVITSPPAATTGSQRPVLERRSTTSSGGSKVTPPTSGTKVTRPSSRVRSGGGTTQSTLRPRSGITSSTVRPTVRSRTSGSSGSSSSGSAVRRSGGGTSSSGSAARRSSGGSTSTRSTVRPRTTGSSSSGSTVRRSGGGSSSSGSTARRSSGGSSSSGSTARRSSGGGSTSRSTARRSSGGGSSSSRSTARRSSGGGGSTSRTTARSTRPPTRRSGGGGGEAY